MPQAIPLEDWRKKRDADVAQRFSKSRDKYHKPLTANHRRYMQTIENTMVTICVGPAGTGKTTLACQVAAKMIQEGKIEKIVISRPLVECGEKLGTLPGGVDEKMAMFTAPMVEGLKRALGAELYMRLKEKELIEVIPLGQMRGKTFDNAVVIIDEPQNATYGELHMALTRPGFGCHMVLCGDLRQSDLVQLRIDVPLLKAALRLKKLRSPEIIVCMMTKEDVLRPDLVSLIDEALGAEDTQCDSNPLSATTMTACLTEPAPSYGAKVGTSARRVKSNSASSKGRGS